MCLLLMLSGHMERRIQVLTPKGYKSRIIDTQISELMNIYGAVCVEGPKL